MWAVPLSSDSLKSDFFVCFVLDVEILLKSHAAEDNDFYFMPKHNCHAFKCQHCRYFPFKSWRHLLVRQRYPQNYGWYKNFTWHRKAPQYWGTEKPSTNSGRMAKKVGGPQYYISSRARTPVRNVWYIQRNALSEIDFANRNKNIGTHYLTNFKMYVFHFSDFSISEIRMYLWHVKWIGNVISSHGV